MTAPTVRLIHADVSEGLAMLPDASVSLVVTSPPYYGLRAYDIPPRVWADGTSSIYGEEDTVQRYVAHTVEIFRDLKRVLHPRGSFWLNLGDCYAGGGKHSEPLKYQVAEDHKPSRATQRGLSNKCLLMVPARVALALVEDGWILRQDNIWAKGISFCRTYSGSVMPESTRDRTTWAHEHIFHFTLRDDAFYDIDGCREAYAESTLRQTREGYQGRATKAYAEAGAQDPSDTKRRILDGIRRRAASARTADRGDDPGLAGTAGADRPHPAASSGAPPAGGADPSNKQDAVGNPTYTGFNARWAAAERGEGRNLRNVWVIPKRNFPGAHFSTFSPALIEPIVKLGSSPMGVCAQCGAPVQRRTVREPVPEAVQAAFEASRASTVADTGRTDGHTHRKPNYRRKVLTTEWEPTCQCDGALIEPAVVLDPFAGSGSAGIAAVGLGRSFIGIDLGERNIRMMEAAFHEYDVTVHRAVDRCSEPDSHVESEPRLPFDAEPVDVGA